MMKRLTWFVGGAVAGIAGSGVAKRKVKARAAQLAPAKLARGAASRVGDAVAEGRRAMRAKELELRGRLHGAPVTTLADEIGAETTLLAIDDQGRVGEPIEPGKVIVLRDVNAAPRRRRGA